MLVSTHRYQLKIKSHVNLIYLFMDILCRKQDGGAHKGTGTRLDDDVDASVARDEMAQ